MKKFLLSVAGLCLTGAAYADVKVESLVINQSAPIPSGTNIRINLHNDGTTSDVTQHVELQAREDSASEWKTVKSWDTPTKVASGNRQSLDYFPASDGYMDSALTTPTFEVRAVVTSLNGSHSMEQAFTR